MFLTNIRLNKQSYSRKRWNVNVYSWLLQRSKNCDNAVCNYAYALRSVPDYSKTQTRYNKAVSTYSSAIQFVPDSFKIKEMCDKDIETCPFVFDSAPDRYITQNLCNKVVSKILLC